MARTRYTCIGHSERERTCLTFPSSVCPSIKKTKAPQPGAIPLSSFGLRHLVKEKLRQTFFFLSLSGVLFLESFSLCSSWSEPLSPSLSHPLRNSVSREPPVERGRSERAAKLLPRLSLQEAVVAREERRRSSGQPPTFCRRDDVQKEREKETTAPATREEDLLLVLSSSPSRPEVSVHLEKIEMHPKGTTQKADRWIQEDIRTCSLQMRASILKKTRKTD